MNIKIEILEIIPKIKYLKNTSSEIISILISSGKSNIKIHDIEKAIKEQKKFNIIINQNNTIKLSLMKNNSYIIGEAEFQPINDIKWINIKEKRNCSINENLLTISSKKRKESSLGKNNEEKYNYLNNEYYLTTIKNDTTDKNSKLKKSNTKFINNYIETYINNIKLKISTKITSQSKKYVNKNKSMNPHSSLIKGSSQIFLNTDKNKINKIHNNNISTEKLEKCINKDSSIRLKKKLKKVKSSSSIKLSLNQFITNNNLSLNSIYTTINSNNKNILKLNKNNKSLIDKKQKTQYNFSDKKSYIKDENENNYRINRNYYNNTITLQTNNNKIEDIIIDNNFKNKLKSDEMINLNYFNLNNNQTIQLNNINNDCNPLFKTNHHNDLESTNPINKDFLKEENAFNEFNHNTFNFNKSEIKTQEKNNNSTLNIRNVNYDMVFRENNLINDKKINCFKIQKFENDEEIIKIFERFKKDVIIYYTKDYFNDIRDDVLFSELKLIIDKILNLKSEYQKYYKILVINFINNKKNIKLIQNNSIFITKKNNKLETKKLHLNYSNENFNSFDFANKKFLLLGKPFLNNKKIDIFNNLLNSKSCRNIEINNRTKLCNLFLFICTKNINNLNSLTKRYYLDLKKKKEKENNKNIKNNNLSELSALITIQNTNNENDKQENLMFNKTSKMNLKTKKYYPHVKTTNREENKKSKKYFFLNTKSTDKKRVKNDKFSNKFK